MDSCLRFIPNHMDSATLRGLEWFTARRLGLARFHGSKIVYRDHPQVHIHLPTDDGQMVTPCRECREIWFVTMPSTEQIPDLAETFDLRLIVDYHGDVLQLTSRTDSPSRANLAGLATPEANWEWWSHPERQTAMRQSLFKAVAVTTPWEHLVDPLRQFNLNVFHVPDSPVGNPAGFGAAFEQVLTFVANSS